MSASLSSPPPTTTTDTRSIPKKRRRGPVACYPCRERKRKCDALRPNCGSCLAGDWACHWPEVDKRRREFKRGRTRYETTRSASGSGSEDAFDDPDKELEEDPRRSEKGRSSKTLDNRNERSTSGAGSSRVFIEPRAVIPLEGNVRSFSRHPNIDFLTDPQTQTSTQRDQHQVLPSQPSSSYTYPAHSPSYGPRPPDYPLSISSPTLGLHSTDHWIHPGLQESRIGGRLEPANGRHEQDTSTYSAAEDLLSFTNGGFEPTGPDETASHAQAGMGVSPRDAREGIETLSYEYLRPYGPTAINPGLGRVRLSIRGTTSRTRQHQHASPTTFPMSGTATAHTSSLIDLPRPPLVDTHTRLPRHDLRTPLVDVFFDHFGSIFPFVDRKLVDGRLGDPVDAGTILMVSMMCALSARFCTLDEVVAISQHPFCRGSAFADNAKQLLIPLLGMPSNNVVAALLFLAYYELGMNNEAGLWAYTGMAMRMVTDLGGHRKMAGRFGSRSCRTLFWCVYLLDRSLSIGTGRPVTFLDAHIEITQPELGDQTLYPSTPERPSLAFAYTIRLTQLYGSIAQLVNASPYWLPGYSGDSIGVTAPSSPNGTRPGSASKRAANGRTDWVSLVTEPGFAQELSSLAEIENSVISLYEALPSSLTWNIDNLTAHIRIGDGDMYLHLHLWYYCILAILYREPFIHARAAFAQMQVSEAVEIQKTAARSIQDIVASLDSQNRKLLLNNPFVNQCFYVAASTWASDIRSQAQKTRAPLRRAKSLLSTSALVSFTVCAKVLREQADVWLGVGWIAAALAKRSDRSIVDNVVKGGATDTILSEAEMRIISSCDRSEGDTNVSEMWQLRDSVFQSLDGVVPESTGSQAAVPLWDADGLFGDQEFNQLFFDLTQYGDFNFQQ